MNQELYWTACQTTTDREREVYAEIMKAEYGAFLPAYTRRMVRRGRLVDSLRALLPGYVIFQTSPEGWGAVGGIRGVHRVLAHGQRARPIAGDEMFRLMMDNASGMHNEIVVPQRNPGCRRRRRRPRPSKHLNKRSSTISGG